MFDRVLITTLERVVKYMLKHNAKALPRRNLVAQSQRWKHENNVWNLFDHIQHNFLNITNCIKVNPLNFTNTTLVCF